MIRFPCFVVSRQEVACETDLNTSTETTRALSTLHSKRTPSQCLHLAQIQSGKGFDLNVSLFERLIREGLEYKALSRQHRMQPAISKPVRELMYPYLQDADHVHDREPHLGLGGAALGLKPKDSVFFVAHGWPERADTDTGVSSMDSASRVNMMESLMVVKILKYILQQGYAMHEVVVLAPYLGQLRLLMLHMREQGVAEMADKRDEEELERQGLELDQVLDSALLNLCTAFIYFIFCNVYRALL